MGAALAARGGAGRASGSRACIGGVDIRFRLGVDANDANAEQALLQLAVGGKARGVDDAVDRGH